MNGTYQIYGLRVSSVISLPGLSHTVDDVASDVDVSFGNVSDGLSNGDCDEVGYVVRGDSIVFDVPEVAKFAMRKGSSIVVDPYPSSSETKIRLFLLGSAMGAVLHQRRLIPLHASSIILNGRGIAFAADSGEGKSTLATCFARRSYLVNGDDVAVAELDPDNAVRLRAGVPRIRLLPDSLDTLGERSQAALHEQTMDGKIEIPIPTHDAERSAILKRIYFLEFDEKADSMPNIDRMSMFEAVVALRRNVYRASLISDLGRERAFLDWATCALSTVACYRLRRPKDLQRLAEIGDFLEGHLSGVD